LNDIVFKIENSKTRSNTFKILVEEALTKRPFAKILVLTLLEDPSLNENGDRADFAKVIR
jgi:hypothetical protein